MPKSVSRAVLRRMQFTLHGTRRTPHGVSRLVQAMSAWLVKTRRAPSRYSRDVRVYGHTTTAMHKLTTPPPLLPRPVPLPGLLTLYPTLFPHLPSLPHRTQPNPTSSRCPAAKRYGSTSAPDDGVSCGQHAGEGGGHHQGDGHARCHARRRKLLRL